MKTTKMTDGSIKPIHILTASVVSLLTLIVIGAIMYSNGKSRDAYLECLKVTERVLTERDSGNTPYCRQ